MATQIRLESHCESCEINVHVQHTSTSFGLAEMMQRIVNDITHEVALLKDRLYGSDCLCLADEDVMNSTGLHAQGD